MYIPFFPPDEVPRACDPLRMWLGETSNVCNKSGAILGVPTRLAVSSRVSQEKIHSSREERCQCQPK
ncbi:hypothetical protein NQ318_001924 [Aromia moschata]|uniref:Uncharacterized protein n=1 Tax=Aromia moschata TaxID=1265417 RepID=A0AAV8Z2Q1_9CUCU|nr:hypothetical protein NQ318_001924 [Aromia moschata]